MTIRDYVTVVGINIFDPSSIRGSKVPSFIDATFLSTLAPYLVEYHGNKLLRGVYSDYVFGDKTALVQEDIAVALISNSYMLEGLYETMTLDYNPIENYRMHEEGTDQNSGSDTETLNKGSATNSISYGSRVDTQNQGAVNDTHIIGGRSSTIDHKVSPDNSASYIAQTQDVSKNANATDQDQFGARSTTVDYGGHTDTATEGSRSDTTKYVHGKKVDHELIRYGNIGVTTSQQMIESQRSLLDLNIYKVVADIIISLLCLLVD